jgi:hypothetical protein
VGYELGASFFSPFENPATGANRTGVDGADAFVKTAAQGTGALGGTCGFALYSATIAPGGM